MFWRKIKNEPEEVLNWRLWVCALVFGLMGAARGLDEGTISGTMQHPSFLNMVGMLDESKSESELADLESNITSMVQIGCVGGAILAYLLSDRIGRLWSFWTLCVLWFVGVIIQITSFNGVGQVYAGRFIAGLGIGMTAVICPTYLVEISPANVRGLCACIYSGSVYLGVLVAQGSNYGTSENLPDSDRNQWVIPTSIQLMYGGVLFIGSFFTLESPRWLFKVGKSDRALQNLSKIRGLPSDHPYVTWEVSQILSQVEIESERASILVCLKQLFTTYFYRMLICILIQLLGQWSGANAITIYMPRFLGLVGIPDDDQLKFTVILGGVKLASSMLVALFLIDTLGRKRSLITGIFIQMFSLIYVAVFVAKGGTEAAANGALAMLYISGFGWALGFNAIQYLINSEIFPLTLRSLATAIIMALHFVNQYGNSRALPPMNVTMGDYGALTFFGCITFIGLLFAIFMVPEPAGHSLEAMDELFSQPWYKVAHYKFQEATLEEKEEKVQDVQHVEEVKGNDNRV